jgi:hypothetical protein
VRCRVAPIDRRAVARLQKLAKLVLGLGIASCGALLVEPAAAPFW